MDAARKKVVRARTSLLLDHPFFGSLCMRMEPREDRACRTAWTDGRVLAYNPAFVEGLSEAQVLGMLAHTVMHPACQHHVRRNGRDAGLWNAACDHAINWVLLDAGFTLPPGHLDDSAYRGMSADAIYAELAAVRGSDGMPSEGTGDGRETGEKEQHEVLPSPGDTDEQGEPGEPADSGDGEGKAGDDGDGGGEGGDDDGDQEAQMQSEMSGDPGGTGEVRDSRDLDAGGGPSGDETDQEWEIALADAVRQARESGELPGGLERLVRELLTPRLDWRELLSRYISERARDDYSWTPPNRRFLHMNVILPSLSHRRLPEVVLALDTSGSVDDRELEQFVAELSGLLETYDTTVHVLCCDAGLTSVRTFSRADLPLEIEPVGGGGTDYRPVFDWVAAEGVVPACLVYLTDMECPRFPEREPEYPVLWARVGGGGTVPPFGDMVEVADREDGA
ncbi:MAG: VWA-like domain-containing protein [Pseudomonadota bacterium]